MITACTCGFRACAVFFCARAPGAAATRPSLRPHLFSRANVSSKARAQRAARMLTCILDQYLRSFTRAMPMLTTPVCSSHERHVRRSSKSEGGSDMRDAPSKVVPDIATLIRATLPPGRPRVRPLSSAPATPSPACAAPSAATAPAAAPATTSAASATAASTPGNLLQVAFLQVAGILPVEEMERGEADIGHFLIAKNEALIGRGVLGLRNIGSWRCRCGAARQ